MGAWHSRGAEPGTSVSPGSPIYGNGLPRVLSPLPQTQGCEPRPGPVTPGGEGVHQEEARAVALGGVSGLFWEPSIWKPSSQGRGGEVGGVAAEGREGGGHT